MKSDPKEIWVKTGYEVFAITGPGSLKIEPLANKVGKSKSSFYHHFADLEVFKEALLQYHLVQADLVAWKEKQAQTIDPDLIQILVEHKIDLLFNRQLRINQNIKGFAETLEESNRRVGNSFIMVWVRELNLRLTPAQIEGIFSLALENFFLQINVDNLTSTWLTQFFTNLRRITEKF